MPIHVLATGKSGYGNNFWRPRDILKYFQEIQVYIFGRMKQLKMLAICLEDLEIVATIFRNKWVYQNGGHNFRRPEVRLKYFHEYISGVRKN